ncbi:hypothetical protein BC835DRAFT_339583 [Cytidiella melzeri]|nr:hypothetical protein BC835DRAFT_339583 [Cytidiella melzeri]
MHTIFHDFPNLGPVPQSVEIVLQRLTNLCSVVVATGEPPLEPDCQERLDSVTDIVQHLSASFERLCSIRDEYSPRSTAALWHMFFRATSLATFTDSVSLADVDVALPRGSLPLEATATTLVSYVLQERNLQAAVSSTHSSRSSSSPIVKTPNLESHSRGVCAVVPIDGPGTADGPSDHDETQSADEERFRRVYDEQDGDMESQDIASEESCHCLDWTAMKTRQTELLSPLHDPGPADSYSLPPEAPPLDLPRDAHIVAGMGPWNHVLLPILCVGDVNSVLDVLASAAYQRCVWKVDIPVIGIETCKYGSRARVYIAWPENCTGNDSDQIHVIRPETAVPTDGSFDMTDPHDALRLGKFIIALRYQFQALHNAIPTAQPRSLKWRYDSTTADPIRTSWRETIQAWVDNSVIDAGPSAVLPSDSSCSAMSAKPPSATGNKDPIDMASSNPPSIVVHQSESYVYSEQT